MSDLQSTHALTSGSTILREELGLLLMERDSMYRQEAGMKPLDNLEPAQYMAAIVLQNAEMDVEVTTGLLCPSCKKNSVISYQKQVRAGDEGTNTFYRCTAKSCGNSYIGK
jgi:DNA-directed RNA polymerase subunit M/transcription elongation factor TFIIS